MVCVLAPLLHSHAVPVLAVKFTELPVQNEVGPPAVMVAIGKAFTVTVVMVEVAEQPAAVVTVTLKLPLLITAMV